MMANEQKTCLVPRCCPASATLHPANFLWPKIADTELPVAALAWQRPRGEARDKWRHAGLSLGAAQKRHNVDSAISNRSLGRWLSTPFRKAV